MKSEGWTRATENDSTAGEWFSPLSFVRSSFPFKQCFGGRIWNKKLINTNMYNAEPDAGAVEIKKKTGKMRPIRLVWAWTRSHRLYINYYFDECVALEFSSSYKKSPSKKYGSLKWQICRTVINIEFRIFIHICFQKQMKSIHQMACRLVIHLTFVDRLQEVPPIARFARARVCVSRRRQNIRTFFVCLREHILSSSFLPFRWRTNFECIMRFRSQADAAIENFENI